MLKLKLQYFDNLISHNGGSSSLVEGFTNCYFHRVVVQNNKICFDLSGL